MKANRPMLIHLLHLHLHLHLHRLTGKVPVQPCGMAPLSREVARGKLRMLNTGAEMVRKELSA